jgi:hypothetical protein
MLERFGHEVPQAFADAAARNAYDETAKAVVAGMLLKQALAFAELDQEPEALVTVENLLERFGHEPGADFEPLLAMAREFRDRLREDAEGSDPEVP